MRAESILASELSGRYPSYTPEQKKRIRAAYEEALGDFHSQVVVLDDDPTGTQTVHDIYVYTEMTKEAIRAGFEDGKGLFYLLTNSRSFSEKKTGEAHRKIAEELLEISGEKQKDFLLISRGDSTLRGHYPLETDVLKNTLEAGGYPELDGLILCPFFPEGGRFTAEDIHYCLDGETLVPAGMTEFAKDATFGFSSSDLKEYVEEKSGGRYPAGKVLSISLSDLRGLEYEKITELLMGAKGFCQIIVNALEYTDLEVFTAAFLKALGRGKHFLIRSAAGIPRVIGGIPERDFLSREELLGAAQEADGSHPGAVSMPTGASPEAEPALRRGGLILVGSHVKKTNQQMEKLREVPGVVFLEFDTSHAFEPGALKEETKRAGIAVEQVILSGRTAVLHTSRKLVLPENKDPEAALRISVEISLALTDVVAALTVEPAFILAKGGITSSDTAVRGLGIKKALVMGQADKGIPVWREGPEAKFPGRPYIVFPGNVGNADTLARLARKLV